MHFSKVSYNTMEQLDSIIIMAAGPSVSLLKNEIIGWKNEHNALVIGAHYKYFLEPTYTIFESPRKFKRGQGCMGGKYVIGPRIVNKMISKNFCDRIIRMEYTPKKFIELLDDGDFNDAIPYDGAGVQAMFVSIFCRPKNLLFVGFDGFENDGKSLIIRHANIKTSASPRHHFDVIKKDRVKNYLKIEDGRKTILRNFLNFIIEKKRINVYIFRKDNFRGIDKEDLGNIGVKII